MKLKKLILPFAFGCLLAGCKSEQIECQQAAQKITDKLWIQSVQNNKPKLENWQQFAKAAEIDISLNGITPEKLASYTQNMREQMGVHGTNNFADAPYPLSLLFGRNVTFTSDWLNYIGDNENPRHISEENFLKWRNRSDMVYDVFVYLTGYLPHDGQSIQVGLVDMDVLYLATMYPGRPVISFSQQRVVTDVLDFVNNHDSWSFAIMHELSHHFDYDKHGRGRGWRTDETFANFKIPFAMEILDGKFHIHEHFLAFRENSKSDMVTGNSFREGLIFNAQEKLDYGHLATFAIHSKATYSEFDLYLHRLSKYVGWEPIMLAFRSYDNKKLEELLYDTVTRSIEMARTFIERIIHFSGRHDLLELIMDKKALSNLPA